MRIGDVDLAAEEPENIHGADLETDATVNALFVIDSFDCHLVLFLFERLDWKTGIHLF